MSSEYPCVYFEKDGKCRKFSDENTTSYCVMGPCPDGCKAESYCRTGHNGMLDWLQQPVDETML